LKTFAPTELVLNAKHQVYHLGISAENLAHKIILVGDQERVPLVAAFFDKIEFSSNHREFFCQTGTYKNKRISVISTGIGTDNIDIVINEIDAAFNIDTNTRTEKSQKTKLEILRLGTCGLLQRNIPIHSYILSEYAMGLDNIGHFYNINYDNDEQDLLSSIIDENMFPAHVHPYIKKSTPSFLAQFETAHSYKGITITSSGFYAPQGRELRIPTRTQNLHEKIEGFKNGVHRFVNFEMESSALFALGTSLGHSCGTICLGIANRPAKTFSSNYIEHMSRLIEHALENI
jgi:uridine phosphorylase